MLPLNLEENSEIYKRKDLQVLFIIFLKLHESHRFYGFNDVFGWFWVREIV